jgi:hypothetical protein
MNYIPLGFFDTDTTSTTNLNSCFCDTVTITNTSGTRNMGANIPWCQYWGTTPGIDDNSPICFGPGDTLTIAIQRGASVTLFNGCVNTGGSLSITYNRSYCKCVSFATGPIFETCNQNWTFRNCSTGTSYNIAVNDLNTGSFGIGSIYYLNGISNTSGTFPAGCYEVMGNVAWNTAGVIHPGQTTSNDCAFSMIGAPLGAIQYDSCFLCKRYNP